MNYRTRHLEKKLETYSSIFPIVVVTGARQVGKSTLLSHLFGKRAKTIVFDPVVDVGNARQDPEFFLKQNPPPLILDEIQYAPELLSVLKRRVDEDPTPGQYYLTGSQNLSVLKNVSESMAGRAIILDLWSMSIAERNGVASTHMGALPFILEPQSSKNLHMLDTPPLQDLLWRGGFPRLLDLESNLFPDILSSYARTYLERDVRALSEVADIQQFHRFLMLCASMTGQEINHSKLGRELGVSPQTAQRWLSVLMATYQWVEILPYYGSTAKRLSRRPKGYLSDTGLACFLQRISSPEALLGHPGLGALFESHVAMELIRSFQAAPFSPNLYHWRTHAGAEVDLLVEHDGIYKPIEIKCRSRIRKGDITGIRRFRETYPHLNQGPGFVIYAGDEITRISDDVYCLPYNCL